MSEAPATPQRRSAAQRLREVARDLFYRQGIRATGVEQLCRLAGTTKISLYRAFPSKDELVACILRDDCEQESAWYQKALGPDLSPRERPSAFLAAAAAELRQPGFRGCSLGLAIAEFPDPQHPARKVADTYKRRMRDTLRRICAEAGASDPEMVGDALMMLVEGAFSSAAYLGASEAAASLERAGQKLLASALPPVEGGSNQ
ncbi:TetR/AcrR family transcriptional regulator [Roseomonas xinghualingensis]|uniref:TetR/AcrR family transcriptional regulator n=1 Tax=Roseomonas xinghualingensis TaxID=2986475 RepID=UPI0021F0F50F|nr:TetR/AcrR family transcriptional regulator [Roseomonas sp. SXEYE001]MCV4209940.1 TetR/AcrR family transcriptional regulator [Roseomonas sp. SXEYE001]